MYYNSLYKTVLNKNTGMLTSSTEVSTFILKLVFGMIAIYMSLYFVKLKCIKLYNKYNETETKMYSNEVIYSVRQ